MKKIIEWFKVSSPSSEESWGDIFKLAVAMTLLVLLYCVMLG